VNRRRFVAALGAGAAGALAADAWLVEPRRLEVTRHALDAPRPGGERLTFVQITDLHLQNVGRLHRHLAGEVARVRPHFVVFTGDSVDRREKLTVFAEFLGLLDPRTPKYAILGNWEYWGEVDLADLSSLYARHGGRLLVNETALFEHGRATVAVTGVDDLLGGRPDLGAAMRGVAPASAHLLLAHCPGYRDRLAPKIVGPLSPAEAAEGVWMGREGFRAMLSGHTHGGQVRVLGWEPMLPRGSGRYVRGWYREPGWVPLYVSRGIGTSVVPVRFGSVPELAVFTTSV
jgi:uncharacterized protein